MAPNSHQEARLRKAVLSLAKETEFGKRMVNGGRLSVPSVYEIAAVDRRSRCLARRPAARRVDARMRRLPTVTGTMFLTEAFIKRGTGFTLLEFGNGAALRRPRASA